MRFTCTAGVLSAEVGLLLTVAGKRTTLAILNTIHLRTETDGLVLTATDLECTLRSRIPAEVAEPGELAMDAKRLHGLAASFEAADRISFAEQKDLWMSIECGGTKLRVPGVSAHDFPAIPTLPEADPVSAPADVVAELLRRASPAGDMRDMNWSGMRLSVKDGVASMASTDGRRMVFASQKVEAVGEIAVVASLAHFDAMAKLLALGDSGSVALSTTDARAFARVGDRLLIAKLDDRRFPSIAPVLKKNRDNAAEAVRVDRKRFIRMVQRAAFVSGVAKDDVPAVRIRLGHGQLEIRAEGQADSAELVDVVEVAFAGDPIERAVSAGYLRDFLSTATSERVRLAMNLTDDTGSVLDDDDLEHACIIMTRHIPDASKLPKSKVPA